MKFSSDLIEREVERALEIIERVCDIFEVELSIDGTSECESEQNKRED